MLPSTIDQGLVTRIFWQTCMPDFPTEEARLLPLLHDFNRVLRGEPTNADRHFARQCTAFFKDRGKLWQRYEHWRAGQGLPPSKTDEELDEWPAYSEMGDLLAHRLQMSYFGATRLERLLDNLEDRPVWRLIAIEDGRTPESCLVEARTPHHARSAYWKDKKLPCERLFCRCQILAMTIREAAEWIAAADARPA